MAKKANIKKNEEAVIDATIAAPADDAPAEAAKPGDKLVTVHLPVACAINGKEYVGTVKVPLKVAEVLIQMAQKKQKSDMRVLVGKNFNVQRLTDNTLIVKEEK